MSTDYKEYPHRHHHNRRFSGNNRGGDGLTQPSKSSVLESNGPGGKLRGTAAQLVERYVTLSREAQREGDTVLTQSFLQYADHYRRLAGDHNAPSSRGHGRPQGSAAASSAAPAAAPPPAMTPILEEPPQPATAPAASAATRNRSEGGKRPRILRSSPKNVPPEGVAPEPQGGTAP